MTAKVPDYVTPTAYLQTKLLTRNHSVTTTQGAQGHKLIRSSLYFEAYLIDLEKPQDNAFEPSILPLGHCCNRLVSYLMCSKLN